MIVMLGYIDSEFINGIDRIIVKSDKLFLIKTPEQDLSSAYIIFTFKELFRRSPHAIVKEIYDTF
jgi:hypothetical protein